MRSGGATGLASTRPRIQAGRAGAREATAEQWQAVIDRTHRAADCTVDDGVELAFELHGGTRTDDPHTTVRKQPITEVLALDASALSLSLRKP